MNARREDLATSSENASPKPIYLLIDHIMNTKFDPNGFKNPKLNIKISSFGDIDIARYNPLAFWPGCANNRMLQGSLYPTIPLLTLKTQFRSTDQLNYAMVYYAHVDILNKKEEIMLTSKYLAMNYDIFKNHYLEIRNEIHKRQDIFEKISDSSQGEFKSLSKIEQDKKLAEVWHYYETDKVWEELRR